MGEYYGVIRAPNYLSHALERGSGAVGVYKNHKYIARAMTTSGKYRYFYDSVELAAYKNQRANQTNSLRKVSDGPSGASGSGSSQSKSLRERLEERQGLLSDKSKKKGSGGSGGSGRSSGGSGGSGGADKPQTFRVKKATLSSGASTFRGYNQPTDTKKKKKYPKHYGIRLNTGLTSILHDMRKWDDRNRRRRRNG